MSTKKKKHIVLKNNSYPEKLIRKLIQQTTLRQRNNNIKTSKLDTTNSPKKYCSVKYRRKLSEKLGYETRKGQNITSPINTPHKYSQEHKHQNR